MTDSDSIHDSTGSTAGAKRKIPAVTEVVAEIARRRPVAASERPGLFQAAQHVCTDEIRLVRTGFAPATVEELADRTEKTLGRRESGKTSTARWNENEPFGDLTVASGTVRRRPELAEELWPSKPDPVRPIRLPEAESLSEASPARVPTPSPAPARSDRPIVSSPVRHASRLPFFVVVVILVGAAAGYLLWKSRQRPAAIDAAAPARAAAAKRVAPAPVPAPIVPAPPEPRPAPKAPPRTPPVRIAAASSGESAPASQSRAGTMRSADWNGAPEYVLHCSSYRKRENAERDAGRLSKLYGRPSHVLGVDLGAEGNWYRVVLGGFTNADEAFAFRSKLLAAKAPEVGLIYQVFAAAASR